MSDREPPASQARFQAKFQRHLKDAQRREVLRALAERIDIDTGLGEIVDAAESLGWGDAMGDLCLAEIIAALRGDFGDPMPKAPAYAYDDDDGEDAVVLDVTGPMSARKAAAAAAAAKASATATPVEKATAKKATAKKATAKKATAKKATAKKPAAKKPAAKKATAKKATAKKATAKKATAKKPAAKKAAAKKPAAKKPAAKKKTSKKK